jgi:hypothetical protein
VDEVEDEDEWKVVKGKKMAKSEKMKKVEGDSEEKRKLIVWGVPVGMEVGRVMKIVVGLGEKEEASEIESLKRVEPAGWQARIDVTLKSAEVVEKWRTRVENEAKERGWSLKGGRQWKQRVEDRGWRGVVAVAPVATPCALKVWSWNARGLNSNKLAQLEDKKAKASIIAVQETWLYDPSWTPRMAGYTFFLENALKRTKTSPRAVGGLCFLVDDNLAGLARVVDRWAGRIMVLEFKPRQQKVYLFNCYGPNTDETVQTRKEFFAQLELLVQKWSPRGETILLGDFNARVGNTDTTIVGRFNEPATNNNSELFATLLKNTNMTALNGRTATASGQPDWTRVEVTISAATGAQAATTARVQSSVLDYVCVPVRHADHATFSVLADSLGSDHYIVSAVLTPITLEARSGTAPSKLSTQMRANFHPLIHDHQNARKNYHDACAEAFEGWAEEFDSIKQHTSSPQEAVNMMNIDILTRLHSAVSNGVPHTLVRVGDTNAAKTFYAWHDAEVREETKTRVQLRNRLIAISHRARRRRQVVALGG